MWNYCLGIDNFVDIGFWGELVFKLKGNWLWWKGLLWLLELVFSWFKFKVCY